MPIYEYKCSNCGHQFEKIQKFSDDPLKKCPNCDKNAFLSSSSISKKEESFKRKSYGSSIKKGLVIKSKVGMLFTNISPFLSKIIPLKG